MEERRSVSHRTVFAVLALTLVAAFGAALVIHDRFARYRPQAAAHLPLEVVSALRLDAEPTIGFEVFERQLLPLVELGRVGPEPRAKHLERKTTIELAVDSREVVFAEISGGAWLVLAGGLFRHDAEVLKGVLRLAQDEGAAAELKGDVVVFGRGPAFTVADDGTLILASDEHWARRTRAITPRGTLEPLLQKPAAVFSVVRYPQASEPWAGDVRRFWAFFEPGDERLPAYLDGVLSRKDARPDLTALSRAALAPVDFGPLQAQPAPRGVVAASLDVAPGQFEAVVASFAAKIGEHLSGSFAP